MTRARNVTGKAQRYGHGHRTLRAKIQPVIDRGDGWCAEVICLESTRWIAPGSMWDLAHDDLGNYRGPAHARCNRAEAARRGNRTRHGHADGWHSRGW